MWPLIARGRVGIDGERLGPLDGAAFNESGIIEVVEEEDAEVLLLDLA